MGDKIGVIVDGPGDFAALKRRLVPKAMILKTDGPRGHSSSVEQIVGGSRKQLAMLADFGCTRMIVVTDFEKRAASYEDFVRRLSQAFAALSPSAEAAVPNRMMENWYLADIKYLSSQKSYLRAVTKQKSYEGQDGKQVLRRLFQKKTTYNEVRHGAELFALVRFDEARRWSESLARFIELAACE